MAVRTETQMTSEFKSMPKTLTSITQDEATRVIATVEAEVSAIDVSLPTIPDREANRP